MNNIAGLPRKAAPTPHRCMMDSILGYLGMIFFMFLVLAAAVEVILEVFRGALEAIGISWARSKTSLTEALKLSSEFSLPGDPLDNKILAIIQVTSQYGKKLEDKKEKLDALRESLKNNTLHPLDISKEINLLAADVKYYFDKQESHRIFALRFLSAIIGCLLTWQAHFYVLQMLSQQLSDPTIIQTLDKLHNETINIIIGGLGAAAGSSYWHDKLDKIRNIKNAIAEFNDLRS